MGRNKTPIVEGPLGHKMREDVARYLEAYQKTLGSGELIWRKKDYSTPAPQIVAGETADISWVSVEVADASGDVVVIDGIDHSQFDLRPVGLWSHFEDNPAIGRWAWIRKELHPCGAKGMLGKLIYDPDEFSQTLYAKSETGSILGRSIGFYTHPSCIRAATEEELANPLWEGVNDVITKCVLTEISVCNIQCNPLAQVDKTGGTITPVHIPQAEEKALAPVEKKTILIKKRLTQRDYDRIYMEELKRIDVEAIVRREIQMLR